MKEILELQKIVNDDNRSAEERKAAAEHILALQGQQVDTETKAPTEAFVQCVLWHTWRNGSNGGAGKFEDWRETNAARLTQVWNKPLLEEIARLEAVTEFESAVDKLADKLHLGILRRKLSWAFDPMDRNFAPSCHVLE